jgi:hypothetical protein
MLYISILQTDGALQAFLKQALLLLSLLVSRAKSRSLRPLATGSIRIAPAGETICAIT